VKVTAEPGFPLGRVKESLNFDTMVKNKEHKFVVPVVGYRPGPYRILPTPGVVWRQELSMLDFGTIMLKKQNTFALPFFFTNYEGELKLLGAESDVPDLKVRLESLADEESQGKKRYKLVFEFPPKPTNRNTAPFGTVVVKTNHPDAPELKLFLKFASL
jgi:hypothetical protein